MMVAFKAVSLDTDGSDREGMLAFDGDVLLAVIVKLSDLHGDQQGRWSMEACFFFAPPRHSFGSLDDVAAWLVMARARRGVRLSTLTSPKNLSKDSKG